MYLQSERNDQYLSEIIRLFIVKEKQSRFLEFVRRGKRYDDLLDALFIDERNLKPECLIEVRSNERSPEIILHKLQKLGAGDAAYVVSCIGELDGKSGGLREIVSLSVGNSIGTFVYCIGARLGYYENDEMFFYILKA